jgi:hypothetical protein
VQVVPVLHRDDCVERLREADLAERLAARHDVGVALARGVLLRGVIGLELDELPGLVGVDLPVRPDRAARIAGEGAATVARSRASGNRERITVVPPVGWRAVFARTGRAAIARVARCQRSRYGAARRRG